MQSWRVLILPELDTQYFAIGTRLSEISTEDLDRDGDIDRVVTNRFNSSQTAPGFVLFLNDGNGQFGDAVKNPIVRPEPP